MSKLTNTDCKTAGLASVYTIVGLHQDWISAIAGLPSTQAITFIGGY